ncbi:hypothetical protein RIF29_12562 [Crotalaria pallida]|uniref:Uncharacterized protein n=1 Tax=Crotalaria pallida TaxID=3830 RepID=A0AAN9P1V1_CROPI
MVTGLCGVRFFRSKKSSPSSSSPSNPLEIAKDLDASTPPSNTIVAENPQTEIENSENSIETENNKTKGLPLPPAMQQPKDSLPTSTMMNRTTSERRSSFSLSLKVPRSFSVARNRDHNKSFSLAKNWDQNQNLHQKEDNIKGKLRAEDSVWMKTIILGEKCVPGEEDPVIYEGKGKRISAYHPKNSSSISISRQVSFIDPDAFSVPQSQIQEERMIQNHQ